LTFVKFTIFIRDFVEFVSFIDLKVFGVAVVVVGWTARVAEVMNDFINFKDFF